MIKEDSLALETRRKIYDLILNYPGLHEREIARKLNMSLSTLDYHLHYLEKREIIVSKRDGRYTRYFVSLKVGTQDKKIIAILRQKTPRNIVLFLLMHQNSIHKEICEAVKKSPSTVSFHLKKIIEAGIVEAISLGRETSYSVKDREQVIKILITYRSTFVDGAVDRFVETWSSLNPDHIKK
ncbi:MAG: ArsR family transcriptional regulator [Candidatus Thermoplasmatota archaeon]|nr:ArsR family transcriptional regulator [Candidatus Thermoplasmatota archaeon]